MICELCGSKAPFLKDVIIEGSRLMVCPKCATMGTMAKKDREAAPASVMEERLSQSKRRGKPRNIYENQEAGLAEDYSERIQNARQKKGLTREEMGLSINEKASVIGKLENETLHPDDALRKKIESFLNISLQAKPTEGRILHHTKSRGLTLGDLIKLKMKK